MKEKLNAKIRCAVYCRKSSEEGLEQEFNSLDAQRDAGLAYIASQVGEGWIAVGDRYEDGGFSGGNLERPALKRLLGDIERGLVDCVVVYKVDRLTRALTDFAKLVDLFDKHGVSFVSVTQSFNTITPTWHLHGPVDAERVAQFRPVRTRIGGRAHPRHAEGMRHRFEHAEGARRHANDVIDRKLVVNGTEADPAPLIFRRFLEIGSATRLVEELAAGGHTTKSWTTKDGKARTGGPIDKTFVYKLLNNRVYLGEAVHKGVAYPGEHDAVIDRRTWDRVHTILAENAHRRGNQTRAATPAPLKGLLRCAACGSAMTPSHTRRRGKLYRYYVCSTAIKQGHANCPVRAVAANEAEALVLAQMRTIFRAPEIAVKVIAAAATGDGAEMTPECAVIEAPANLETVWDQLFPAEQNRLLHLLIERIDVATDGFRLRLRAEGLRSLTKEFAGAAATRESAA
jgi:site-specific DNA recombinase